MLDIIRDINYYVGMIYKFHQSWNSLQSIEGNLNSNMMHCYNNCSGFNTFQQYDFLFSFIPSKTMSSLKLHCQQIFVKELIIKTQL